MHELTQEKRKLEKEIMCKAAHTAVVCFTCLICVNSYKTILHHMQQTSPYHITTHLQKQKDIYNRCLGTLESIKHLIHAIFGTAQHTGTQRPHVQYLQYEAFTYSFFI